MIFNWGGGKYKNQTILKLKSFTNNHLLMKPSYLSGLYSNKLHFIRCNYLILLIATHRLMTVLRKCNMFTPNLNDDLYIYIYSICIYCVPYNNIIAIYIMQMCFSIIYIYLNNLINPPFLSTTKLKLRNFCLCRP